MDDFTYANSTISLKTFNWLEVFTTSDQQHYNPINFLFNTVVFGIFKKNVIFYHLLNTVLFYLNCWLLYVIARRVTRHLLTAMMAAVLFCLHPINAEIVNQIVFNTVLLSALLYQTIILLFDNSLQKAHGFARYWALSLTVLALFSLETSILIPVTLCLWAWKVRNYSFRDSFQKTLSFFIIAMGYALIWKVMTSAHPTAVGLQQKLQFLALTPVNFLGTLSYLTFWYIGKLFVPFNAIWIFASQPLPQSLAIFWVMVSLGTIWLLLQYFFRKNNRQERTFLFLWFLCGFALLLPGSLAHAEVGLIIEPYWFYVSSMGFFILLASILSEISEPMQKFRVLLAGIVIGGLLFLGTQRIHMVTRDEKSYSEYWLKISMNPVPLSALAKIAQNEKHYELALRLYELHLNTFAYSPLNENSPWMIELAMASIYIELSQYNQAREFINRALTKNPQAHLAYLLLASIAADHKNYLQAEKYFLKAVDLAPGNRLVMTSLIDFYFFMKEDEKALPLLEKMPISELTNKDRIHCEILRSMIKYKNNDRFAALEILDHILKLYPAENTYKIIIEKYSARLIHEVARYYAQEGLVHYPVSADLRLYYGTILSNMGDHQLALNELRKGAQLFPQDLRFKDRIAKISTRLSIP